MNKRIYFLFALIFLVLLSAIYLHKRSLSELDKSIEWVDHSYVVIGCLNEISGDLKSAQLHSRTLVNSTENYLIANDFADMITNLNELEPIIKDNIQKQRMDSISIMLKSWRQLLSASNDEEMLTIGFQKRIDKATAEIQILINSGITRQKELLAQRNEFLKSVVRSLHRWTIVLIALAFLLVVFTTLYGYRQLKNRVDLEVLLESVLNASQEGIITCRTCREGFKIEDFEILFANSAVKTHLGQDSADLIGKSILYIMPEIQTSGLFAKWIQVVEDGLPDEYEACHKDYITNKDNWYSIKLVKLGDGVTVTFHNITELKGYKENLNIS
jgi:PAS domain-containing protein